MEWSYEGVAAGCYIDTVWRDPYIPRVALQESGVDILFMGCAVREQAHQRNWITLAGERMLGIGTLSKKIFGSPNDRKVKSIRPLIAQINALEPEFQNLKKKDGSLITQVVCNKGL